MTHGEATPMLIAQPSVRGSLQVLTVHVLAFSSEDSFDSWIQVGK